MASERVGRVVMGEYPHMFGQAIVTTLSGEDIGKHVNGKVGLPCVNPAALLAVIPEDARPGGTARHPLATMSSASVARGIGHVGIRVLGGPEHDRPAFGFTNRPTLIGIDDGDAVDGFHWCYLTCPWASV